MPTQNDRILRHIQDYGSITSMEAITEYGVTRLSGRIWDLRAAGNNIVGEYETRMNRYGESVTFKRYRMEG